MASGNEAVESIAKDLGIIRFQGEGRGAFYLRVAYSAMRFWALAFCMDDGANGSEGITKQALNHRLLTWVERLEPLLPGVTEWFYADGDGLRTVYSRLIDIGDIQCDGFDGRCRASKRYIGMLTERRGALRGFFDASAPLEESLGVRGKPVTCGMTSIVSVAGGNRPVADLWWERDMELRHWTDASNYEGLLFADPFSRKWGLGYGSAWLPEPKVVGHLALAKVQGVMGDSAYFIAHVHDARTELSQIMKSQAYELYFFLRKKAGRAVKVSYAHLDENHIRLKGLPVGFMSGAADAAIAAMCWPVEDSKGGFDWVTRTVALPVIRDLLLAAHVDLDEREAR